MPIAAFSRLTQRLLASQLGEKALLRSETADPVRTVNVEHGVDLVGVYGDTVVSRSVVTINLVDSPKVGDALDMIAIDDLGVVTIIKSYKLDTLLNENGYSSRFVLMDV